jgi:hypothetical protein
VTSSGRAGSRPASGTSKHEKLFFWEQFFLCLKFQAPIQAGIVRKTCRRFEIFTGKQTLRPCGVFTTRNFKTAGFASGENT